MYIFGLILFVVGIGLIGLGIFMTLIKMDKKKGSIALGVGVAFIVTTLILYTYRPAISGREIVTVKEATVVEQENGTYRCFVRDEDSGLSYHHEADKEETAKAFCGQFEVGSEYSISFEYDFDNGEYTLKELLEEK